MEVGEEQISVESRVAPPDLSCPKCNGLLPSKLGKVRCVLCEAEVNVEHKLTRKKWLEEKISCPECHTVLIAGVDDRPCHLKCSTCEIVFELKSHVKKVEIQCKKCDRKIRMNKRPGKRKITCPSCEEPLIVRF
jgi:DNA-directed RNA polymerase subunit M/transcription elongation factor TFIIS